MPGESDTPLDITSLQNPRVKRAVQLRNGRVRRSRGTIIIDGFREIQAAFQAGVQLQEVFWSPQLVSLQVREWIDRIRGSLPPQAVQATSTAVIDKLCYGNRGDGILTVATMPETRLSTIQLRDPALLIVLEGIEKPGNLGAIIRSANAAGADAVVVADPIGDLYNPNTIRASLGAVFDTPLAQAGVGELKQWLQQQSIQVLAARGDGSLAYTSADMRQNTAIVLGSEADGLSDLWGTEAIAVAIPMRGSVDSLNVSVAAALLLFEACRQRSPDISPESGK